MLETNASGIGLRAVLAQQQNDVTVRHISFTLSLPTAMIYHPSGGLCFTSQVDTKGGEKLLLSDSTLITVQQKDPDLSELITYLESGKLPADELRAHEFAVTKSQSSIWSSLRFGKQFNSYPSYHPNSEGVIPQLMQPFRTRTPFEVKGGEV